MTNKILCFLRHAEYTRPTMAITPKGFVDLLHLCEKLSGLGLVPDAIYHSGVLRAEQSAAAVHKHVQSLTGLSPDFVLCEAFNESWFDGNESAATAMIEAVGKFPDQHKIVFVVTHYPNIMMMRGAFQCQFSPPETANLIALNLGAGAWSRVQVQVDVSGDLVSSVGPVQDGLMHITPRADRDKGGGFSRHLFA